MSQAVDSLAKCSGKADAERLRAQLQELLERQRSEYDNDELNKAVGMCICCAAAALFACCI